MRLGAVASTQDEAAARLREGLRPPFAVTATRQDSGRGRLGRPFSSPDGASLALTYAHRTSLAPSLRGWFPLAAGLAALTALEGISRRVRREHGLPEPERYTGGGH
jgi:BirA family biotin operon repressor/biotin-[acetyl-CoA-carboxylase] ligase